MYLLYSRATLTRAAATQAGLSLRPERRAYATEAPREKAVAVSHPEEKQAALKPAEVQPLFDGKKRIVVLGSGWGGFNFLRNIDTNRYDVACISPANHFLFTPLLPSCAVGTLEFRAIQEPVRTIPRLKYFQAKAVGLKRNIGGTAVTPEEIPGASGNHFSPEGGSVICKDIFKGEEFTVPYDYLVVTCGSKTHTFNTPGVQEREGQDVCFLKHLYHARQVRQRILECFERAAIPSATEDEKKQLLSFVVVGGGPTSCEFVGELYDFIVEDCSRWFPDLKTYASVTLVEAGPQILSSFDKKLGGYVLARFNKRSINVKTGVAVKSLDGTRAVLSDGSFMPFGLMVWSAGLQPVKFVSALDFEKGPTGRILTDTNLRVKGEADIFAFGDCAVIETQPLPPIAQAALQQAKYLAGVFNKAPAGKAPVLDPSDGGTPPPPFSYLSLGSMAMLGGWRAVADFSHVGRPGDESNIGSVTGQTAFLLWRTAYWGRQVSFINKILIPMYWFKAWLFGRDISRF
eukprot:TRINITY_DN20573_c0_g1_i1.p1 TRINITY_DN20573_c0_g1~~TRINITY_DN20573_c0_g1_i1.p1  ORF type:complete len:516 (+),score=199.13 TRINITY_DN20573_c0_g1_i1:65-1612(+)